MKYKFNEEDHEKIKAIRKRARDKQIDRRLKVLELRCEGKSLAAIVEETEFTMSHVSNLIRKYFEEGIEAISNKHYNGNRRNMSVAQETEFLKKYQKQAEQGQIVTVKEMEAEYKKAVGHSISKGQIYRVLKRQGWRKVMPRSRHPKKASEEVIETSKKLRPESAN